MATGNGLAGAPMVSVPGLQSVLVQWQGASAQPFERSTGMARELVGAGLHYRPTG
jgi:hypothetical protein